MADPRTKEELLAEISIRQSSDESYIKFKKSLQDLTQDIDKLMYPTEEGWKLLDEETMEPLFEKYLETAKYLNAYLQKEKNSKDSKEQAVWDVCNAFRRFFAADMEVLQKYRASKGTLKSMPTLFEEARVQTVTLYSNDLDIKGGSLSSRIPMKVMKKNGKEMDGFFTKAEYFDPVNSIDDIMEKQVKKTENPVGKALLLNFSKICLEFFRKKNLKEDEDVSNLRAILAKMGKVENSVPMISNEAFCKVCAGLIREVGPGRVAEICDIDEDDVPFRSAEVLSVVGDISPACEKLALQWNAIACRQQAGIDPKARLDIRNVAMSDVAELLGIGNIVCEARRMKVRDKDGNESEGIFMAKARGVDPDNPGPGYQMVSGEDLRGGNAMVLKQLADLQVLDYLCGNVDRHGANFFFEFDSNKQIIGIQGIDNDLSFGKLNSKDKSVFRMMAPADMGVISQSLADRILALDPAQFTYTLYGTLDKDEVEAAKTRLENMKEAIAKSREIVADQMLQNPNMDEEEIRIPFGYLREIKDAEWKIVRLRDLYRKNGPKNIFRFAYDTMNEFPLYTRRPLRSVRYAAAGAANRATDEGIISAMKKTKELKDLLERRTKTGRSSDYYRNVQSAVNKHMELLIKIGERMGNCRNKVKEGTAETEEIMNQYITKSDLEKIIASEQKIREMADTYLTKKMADLTAKYRIPANLDPAEKKRRIMQQLDDYPKERIRAMDLIAETFRSGQTVSPDEEASLKANHRKAVEDTAREIRKNPEGPAAGPKNPAQKTMVKNPPKSGEKRMI